MFYEHSPSSSFRMVYLYNSLVQVSHDAWSQKPELKHDAFNV